MTKIQNDEKNTKKERKRNENYYFSGMLNFD
jgi:hypothetical protein